MVCVLRVCGCAGGCAVAVRWLCAAYILGA